MRTVRLAEFLAHKYKVVATSAYQLELSVRRRIDSLYNVVTGKDHKIISELAGTGVSNPTNEDEELALQGYEFIEELMRVINYLKGSRSKLSLREIKDAFMKIQSLIDKNLAIEGNIQFPQVSALIRLTTPRSHKLPTAHINRLLDTAGQKARTGLSRIKSIVTDGLEELNDLGDSDQVDITGRFNPERKAIDMYDIIKFVRKEGDKYGIDDLGDWETVFRNDPQFLQDMTTVVYAADRARTAREEEAVRAKVIQALRDHRARTEGVNTSYFEAGEEQSKQMAQPEQSEEELPELYNTDAKAVNSSLQFERLLRKYE